MEIHSDGLIAAVGEYGPFKDGTRIPYVDWLDGAGSGVYRATLPAGHAVPVALQQGHAIFDLNRRDDGKLSLRVRELQLNAPPERKAA